MVSSNEKNKNTKFSGTLRKFSRTKKSKTTKYDSKTTVIVDGFAISSYRRVSICSGCAKTTCKSKSCSNKHRYLCTSAGHWVSIQRQYKYKILGGYRLKMYIRKCDKNIGEESRKKSH